MTHQTETTSMPLICSRVATERLPEMLPRYTRDNISAINLKRMIYMVMAEYSDDECGGDWLVWELSNDSFYMAPSDKNTTFSMQCGGNFYDGTMTGDAAGVVVCLVAFCRMAEITEQERFIELFYGLREWAMEHPEASSIFAAID